MPIFLTNIMIEHANLPTTVISDKRSAFISHFFEEVTGVLGNTVDHATKNAQTIGILERSHMSIKRVNNIETGEQRSLWHKCVNIAVLNHNTYHHQMIGCEPRRVFHEHIP